MALVPRILHQTWKSKAALDRRQAYWRKSFFLCNPGLKDRFYDDTDNWNIVRRYAPLLEPIYREFPAEIFRVDFVRPLYMFLDGGLYADLDFHCLQGFDRIFSTPDTIFLGSMGTDPGFSNSIPNAILASPPGEGFWIGYLRNIVLHWEDLKRSRGTPHPEIVSGPLVLRKTYLEYTALEDFKQATRAFAKRFLPDIAASGLVFSPIKLLPGYVWYPLDWSDNIHQRFRQDYLQSDRLLTTEEARQLFPSSLAVTYWTHNW
jgi:mannosyltransferase OCH1-like enzyme